MNKNLDAWTGDFGQAYLERNSDRTEADLGPRTAGLAPVLDACPERPRSILEVGANLGRNLEAMSRVTDAKLHAVEPFAAAFEELQSWIGPKLAGAHNCPGQSLPYANGAIDFVFTSGVLIHVPPADGQLEAVMCEIVRVSGRYVWCNEYFAKSPEDIVYRGETGLLFKRDFGRLYLEMFPELKPLATGFLWSASTPFDDTVWWLFEKPAA